MKRIFFLIILMTNMIFTFGQSNSKDSIIKKLNTAKEDTSKVNLLNALGNEIRNSQPQKALIYFEQALKLSRKLGYTKGIAISLFYQGEININLGKYKEAINSHLKSLYIYNTLGDNKGIVKNYKNIGVIYVQQGDLDKALSYFQQALIIQEQLNDKKGIANIYNNIGIVYMLQADYKKALEYYFKSLEINEQFNDKTGIAGCLGNIGSIYYSQGEYDKAIKYYKQTLIIQKEFGSSQNVAGLLYNIGAIYCSKGDYKKAIEYDYESLDLFKKIGNKAGIAQVLNNIGIIFKNQKNYSDGLYNLKESLKISEEINDKKGIAINTCCIGIIYFEQGKYAEAIGYFEESITISIQLKLYDNLRIAYQNLAITYEKSGNIAKAYENYKQYSTIKDSVMNIEIKKEIIELQTKYEAGEKEKEIEIQKLKISQQELKLSRSKMWLTILILIVSLIIIFFMGTFLYYKAKQRTNLKTEMLRQQEARTNAIIETQEDERKRIAQDLHDGIGNKLTTIKINFEKIKEYIRAILPENKIIFEQTANMLDETHKEVRTLSHQMMPKALVEKELTYAISDLLEQTLTNSDIKYRLINDAPNDLPVSIGICIYRVLQELLNNTLKHAHATEISVQIFKNKDTVIIMVEDDGVGIRQNETTTSGIGLHNIAGRIHALNGTFLIEPGPYKGTIATIRIPILPSFNIQG